MPKEVEVEFSFTELSEMISRRIVLNDSCKTIYNPQSREFRKKFYDILTCRVNKSIISIRNRENSHLRSNIIANTH